VKFEFKPMPKRGPTGLARLSEFQALPGEINYDPLDRYSFAHAGMGALMGLFRLPWYVTVLTAVGWDLLERPLKEELPELFPNHTQDTPQHVVTDAAAWLIGWAITKQLMDRRARARGEQE
jgi:hypothetical protein